MAAVKFFVKLVVIKHYSMFSLPDVDGEILDVPVKLTDAGQVTLYNLDISSPSTLLYQSGSSTASRLLRPHLEHRVGVSPGSYSAV